MKKRVNVKLLVALLFASIMFLGTMGIVEAKSDSAVESVFSDVYENEWYLEYIQYVFDNDLMKGHDGQFKPLENITKAEVAQILYNMSGEKDYRNWDACLELKDVVWDVWYTDAVCWAYDNGIVKGDSNSKKFYPDSDVTREQLVLMFYRYAKYKKLDTTQTRELTGLLNAENVSNWSETAVKWAVEVGLLSGVKIYKNGEVIAYDLAPQGTANRAQTAAIMMRFLEEPKVQLPEKPGAEDGEDSSEDINSGEQVDGRWLYEINADGTVTLTGCSGELSGTVVIPEKIDGMTVTRIGEKAFYDCDTIETIQIGKSVVEIGEYAFALCTELKEILFPETLKCIKRAAFFECIKLEKMTLPESLIVLEKEAFWNAQSIKKITVPNGITEILEHTFSGCRKLKTVKLPEGLEKIGDYAFASCDELSLIELPKTLSYIGKQAFEYNSMLNNVWFSGDAPIIHEQAFYFTDTKIFYPNDNSSWQESVRKDYGGTIEWIPYGKNEEVENEPEAEKWIYTENTDGTITLNKYLGTEALRELVIPKEINEKQVSIVGDALFVQNEDLQTVVIPEQIVHIGAEAFGDCVNLQKVEILGMNTSLGEKAFSNCTSLETLSLPSGITEIESGLLKGCCNLKSLTIPNGVTQIKDEAFYGCSSWENIEIPETVKSIGKDAFAECKGLEKIVFPRGLNEIAVGAFYNCENLESIFVPNTVTKIGNAAFSTCKNLKEVVLEEGLSVIGAAMFNNCESLEEIMIPSTVKIIADESFNECVSLKNLVIPESVEKIGAFAFRRCYGLEEIVIPKNVNEIGSGAFMQAVNVKKVFFSGSAPEVETSSDEAIFFEVNTEIYYPANDSTWDKAAFMQIQSGHKNLTWIPYEIID